MGEGVSSHGGNLRFPPLPLSSSFPPSLTPTNPVLSPAVTIQPTENSNFPPLSTHFLPISRFGSRPSHRGILSGISAPATFHCPKSGRHSPAGGPAASSQLVVRPATSSQQPNVCLNRSDPPPSTLLSPSSLPRPSADHPPSTAGLLPLPHGFRQAQQAIQFQQTPSAPQLFDSMPHSTLGAENPPSHFTPFPILHCNPHLPIPQQQLPLPASTSKSPLPSPIHSPSYATSPTAANCRSPLLARQQFATAPKRSYADALRPVFSCSPVNIPPFLPDIPLTYQPPSKINGIPLVSFSEEEMAQSEALFLNSIVLKFYRGNPALRRIREFVATWGLSKPYSVAIMDKRHTLVRMTCEQDLKTALSLEVHKLDSSLFRSFKWSPDFDPKKETSMAAVWVLFPSIPVTLFTPTFIDRVAASLGTLLRLDVPTKDCSRIRFARACIEMDLANPLPSHIAIKTPRLNIFEQPLEYESNVTYCTRCSLQGHSLDSCRHSPKSPPGNSTPSTPKHIPNLAVHTYFTSPSSLEVPIVQSPHISPLINPIPPLTTPTTAALNSPFAFIPTSPCSLLSPNATMVNATVSNGAPLVEDLSAGITLYAEIIKQGQSYKQKPPPFDVRAPPLETAVVAIGEHTPTENLSSLPAMKGSGGTSPSEDKSLSRVENLSEPEMEEPPYSDGYSVNIFAPTTRIKGKKASRNNRSQSLQTVTRQRKASKRHPNIA